MNPTSSLDRWPTLALLLALVATHPAQTAEAQESIPPRMYSTERAGVFNLDQEVMRERFGVELERCRTEPERSHDLVSCLLLEGMVQSFSGQREAGLAALQQGIAVLESTDDHFAVAFFYLVMAEVEHQMGHSDEAIPVYRAALTRIESLTGSSGASGAINVENFGLFARLAGLPEDLLRQAGPMVQLIAPILAGVLEVMARDRFATLLLAQDQLAEAEEQLKLALPASRSLFGMMDAQVLDHLGQLRERQDEFDEAAGFFEQALEAAERTGEVERRYGILRRLAEVETARGRLSKALAALESARRLAQEQGDLAWEARLLSDVIDFHFQQGEMGKARRTVEEALPVAEESGDDWAVVVVRMRAAGTALMTGAYEEAATHLDAASARRAAMESWRPEVTIMQVSVLTQLAQVYYLLGRPEQMGEKAAAAREIARQARFPEGVALSRWIEEWDRYLDQVAKDPEASTEGLRQAGSEARQALENSDVLALREFAQGFGPALESLVLIFGPTARATSRSEAWLAEAAQSSNLLSRSAAALAVARREVKAGRYAEARRRFEEHLGHMRQLGQRDLEALALTALAVLHWKSGEAELAVSRAQEAIQVFETFVGGFHVDDLLASFLGSDRQWLYRVAVEFLARTGQVAEAFDMAERARARALLHQLGNQRLHVKDGDPELVGRLDELRRDILSLESNPSAHDALGQKREQYDELFIQAKLRHPEYADLVSVDPLDLATLKREVLAPHTTLVAYYVAGEEVLAWIVDRENVHMVTIALSAEERQEVLCLSQRFDPLAASRTPNRGGETTRGAEPLDGCPGHEVLSEKYFTRLLAPLLSHVRHERLVLVPHGVLHYVPFAALRDPETGRFLLQMKTLSYAPSASVLRFLAAKSSPFDGNVLVLGDPATDLEALPWARNEAQAVAELFGTEPWVGAAASEGRVRAAAGKVDLIHLAAHGVYRPRTPRFSHIALARDESEDGRLEVEEVFSRLDLEGVNLVTLSACRTALGERTDGDEIVGLTRAFLYAGSPAVVSTLWWVDDRATAFLMQAFYRRLLDGASYAEALRGAQLATLSRPGFGDPYYWAAFTLTGDPSAHWQGGASIESSGEPKTRGGDE